MKATTSHSQPNALSNSLRANAGRAYKPVTSQRSQNDVHSRSRPTDSAQDTWWPGSVARQDDTVFQAIQHVDQAIAILEANPSSGTERKEGNRNMIYGAVSVQQRDVIASAAIEHFLQTQNAPLTVQELCEVLQARGIALAEYAVSSVGGIVGKRAMFTKCSDRAGHWKLTENSESMSGTEDDHGSDGRLIVNEDS